MSLFRLCVDIAEHHFHILDLPLESRPSELHVRLQPQNLSVHRQPVLNTLVNDSKNPLDRRPVVLYFRLIILNLLAHISHIRLMFATVDPIPEFDKAARDRFAHLESLSTSITEDENPTVFAELTAQRFGIIFKLSPLLFKLRAPSVQILASRRKYDASANVKC
jgi:hypothetical protein